MRLIESDLLIFLEFGLSKVTDTESELFFIVDALRSCFSFARPKLRLLE